MLTSISFLVLDNGGIKVTQLSAGHLKLLLLITESYFLQFTLELSFGLEKITIEGILKVVLLCL